MTEINKSGQFHLDKKAPNDLSYTSSTRVARAWQLKDRVIPIGVIISIEMGYYSDTNNNGFNYSGFNSNTEFNNSKVWEPFYKKCDGSICNIIKSPWYGKTLPKADDERFLMGGSSVGDGGGSNTLLDHSHNFKLTATLSFPTHADNVIRGPHVHPSSWIDTSTLLPLDPNSASNMPGKMGVHTLNKYQDIGGVDRKGWSVSPNHFLSDDDQQSDQYLTNTHVHNHYNTAITNLSTPTLQNAIAHTHNNVSINPGGDIGTGVLVTSTDHKPIFLSTMFFIKVL